MSVRRGVWTFIAVLTLAGLAVLFASLRLSQPASSGAASSVLVFDVPSDLEESELPFNPFALDILRRNRWTLYRAIRGLEHAAEDPHVSALVLHIDEVDWGWAKLAEMRDALLEFRESGKPVYACLAGGGDPEYFLASAAGWIAMPPTANLQLDGLSQSVLFMKGTFDKLDIKPNFASAGRFKSAVESYTRTEMTSDSRAALEMLLDDEYRVYVDSIAVARDMSVEAMHSLLDEGPFSSQEALESGLIDTLVYDAEADSMALADLDEDVPTISFLQYASKLPARRGGPRIALIAASGAITGGRSRYLPDEGMVMGSETIVEALEEARTRSSIKAVVLRVDSPGGEMPASDDIWRAISRVREAKPVVVSMSDLAASGGYYISAGADRIVAQPTSLTGSIGIYGGKLNLLGLYRKLGLNVQSIGRGKHAQMMSPFSDFEEDEGKIYQQQLEDSYRVFLDRVSEGRGISVEQADSIGQGRVWSGIAAWEQGLVDTLGGLRTAFDVALDEAGLPHHRGYRVELLPKEEHSLIERLLADWFDDSQDFTPGLPLPRVVRAWMAACRFPAGVSLALMPYSVEIR
jgi:protease-4